MIRFYQDDEGAAAFATSILGYGFAQPYIGMIVERDGEVVSAIIFNGFIRGQNIDMTGVGKVWPVFVIRQIARYCFSRVKRVTSRTCVSNHAAINALEAAGFKREGVMRDYFPDGDAIVFGLLKSEQRIVKVS